METVGRYKLRKAGQVNRVTDSTDVRTRSRCRCKHPAGKGLFEEQETTDVGEV